MQEAFKNLLPYGWAEFFEADYLDSEIKSEEVPAKVIQVERGFYKLALGLDRFVLAEVAGKIRHKAEGAESFPVVGDFVIARLSTDGARAHVTKVLKRKTTLKRQAGDDVQLFAANIDYVFIMTSANDDFNPRRLERYLAMTWDSGAEPVIVLSKIDLSQSTEEYIRELENISYKGPVVLLSSLLGTGLKDLENYLSHAKTSVVVGSSGVGKSTLINKLLGREVIFTQDIREDDDKGRHTTTSRSLYVLPSGGLLIDTPGIRELQLAPSEIGLKQSFQDIEEIVAKCKFTN
jgi:ribosome biogenesis GTPase